MVVNNTLQLKLFRRKGIQYIQLYTAISREEFFQYMFILYYFGFPCGVLCRGGVWGGGGVWQVGQAQGRKWWFNKLSTCTKTKKTRRLLSLSTKFCR
jgi:hypothetical protein